MQKIVFLLPMSSSDHIAFELLKRELADTYRISYPSCTAPIEEWKGQDIVNFQEELIKAVKGRISEKWFYTHIKSKGEKLPRIDMLNMLSQYAGYQDWRDFTNKKGDFTKEKEPEPEIIAPEPIVFPQKNQEIEKVAITPSFKKGLLFVWMGAIIFISVALFFLFKEKERTYTACFTDVNGGKLIKNAGVEIRILKENESPVPVKCDSSGCFEYTTTGMRISYNVLSPYYKTETITRVLSEKRVGEQIKLKTNDYALMIHYFSSSKVNDWKDRRIQLDDMIAADAKIYQVYSNGSGMELYNKEEFINKLTMPLKSLKNIEIIETDYSGNQISLLRFTQTE